MKTLFFANLFLILGITAASAQVKLSFNPPKGAKYEYQTETISNVKQSVMGQEIPMEQVMNMTYLMEIKDKTPQEIQAQLTYKDMAYSVSSPMIKISYDSKKPAENPSEMDKAAERAFSNLINKSFLIVFAPDGSVKSVKELETTTGSAANIASANWQVDAQMAAQINQQYGEDAMKNLFEQSFKIYPANAVKAGDTWNIEGAITIANMNAKHKTKYTLKEVNRNMATVAMEADFETDMGAMMEGKITGSQTGAMIINTDTGLHVTGDMTQNGIGILKMQGMDVQMELTSKSKVLIKEIK